MSFLFGGIILVEMTDDRRRFVWTRGNGLLRIKNTYQPPTSSLPPTGASAETCVAIESMVVVE